MNINPNAVALWVLLSLIGFLFGSWQIGLIIGLVISIVGEFIE